MSRSFSSQILAELESKELRPFLLLAITISGTTYRYTDCDAPIHISNTYLPRGIKIQPVKYSMGTIVDKLTFTIDNIDSAFSGLFVGSTPQGSETVLKSVVLDSSYDPVAGTAITIFEGELDSWELAEDQLKASATSMFHQWSQKTFSKHSPSCRWKAFKSTECDYSGGETWCDKTHTRCVALSNSTNFGGYRWLPSIVDKEIWWGRQGKVD